MSVIYKGPITEGRPVYMYQCIKCDKNMYTTDQTLRHCGRLTQWISGVDGKGIDMKSPRVRIEVSGYIEIPKENLDVLMRFEDPHRGIIESIPLGYVKSKSLEFKVPEEE